MNKEEITFKEKNGEDLLYFQQLIQNYSKSQLAEANIDLQRENKELKEHIEKYERYCKTTGIKELMENKKYKEENEFLKSEIEETKKIIQKYLEYIDERDERIDKAIEYLENNSLYEEEYDYDYEENSYLSGINDETAKKDLLKILKEVE